MRRQEGGKDQCIFITHSLRDGAIKYKIIIISNQPIKLSNIFVLNFVIGCVKSLSKFSVRLFHEYKENLRAKLF